MCGLITTVSAVLLLCWDSRVSAFSTTQFPSVPMVTTTTTRRSHMYSNNRLTPPIIHPRLFAASGTAETGTANAPDAGEPASSNNAKSSSVGTDTFSLESSIQEDTVWSKRGPLFRMTRPSSVPGVVLFHMVGTYLALSQSFKTSMYWSILLKQPYMWLTLLCEILVSATSMIINDYYDAKLGRDEYKQVNLQKKVLLNGQVSLPLTKRFVTYLYSLALLLVCFLPGAPTRLMVTSGLMLTYLYTKHLKPIFGVKNLCCASLVALTPWTSASACMCLTGGASVNVFGVPSLWRLFAALFFGVLGREIMLDCNDVVPDKEAGIDTLPVEYGCSVSSAIALASTVCMSVITTSQPLLDFVKISKSSCGTSLFNMFKASPGISRRLGFAFLASIIMLRRSWQVYRTKGEDSAINSRAVDESLITVVFLLASFV